MKKRIMATIIASAMIAASSLAAVTYAEAEAPVFDMDNPFSGCFEKQEDGTWKITDRGIALIKEDMDFKDEGFYFHFTFTEKLDSLCIDFSFKAGEKSVGYLEELMKLDGRTEIYLPVAQVIKSLAEKAGENGADLTKIEEGSIDLGVMSDMIDNIEITATDKSDEEVFDLFDRSVWAAYSADEGGEYTAFSSYFIFYDKTSGGIENNISGVPFEIEQKGYSAVLHLGSVDDNTNAVFEYDDDGALYATLGTGEGAYKYKLIRIPFADPDTFEASAPLFRGVWAAYDYGEDGDYNEQNDLFSFISTEEGIVLYPDGKSVPFTCDQNGLDVVFRFGYGDGIAVKLDYNDDGDIIADFEDGSKFRFTFDSGLDPDTFTLEADEEETAPEASDAPELANGVWVAYDENNDIQSYFVFNDETTGRTITADGKSGLPFDYEQNGADVILHLGSADDTTMAHYDADTETWCFDYGEVTFTYVLERLDGEEPDTFTVMPRGILDRGVYELYEMSEDGEYDDLAMYLLMDDGESGSTRDPEMGIGLPFVVDQRGDTAIFHFASADDMSPADFWYDEEDGIFCTIHYNNQYDRTFKIVSLLEDPDTFEIPNRDLTGIFTQEDGIFVLNGPAETLTDANGVAGGGVGLRINFAMPLLEGFDLQFVVVTKDNEFRNYTINRSETVNNDTLFIRVRDILEQSGANPDEIEYFGVRSESGSIVSVDITADRTSCTELEFRKSAAVDADTENPKTGAADLAAALALAAVSGAAAIAAKKRRA